MMTRRPLELTLIHMPHRSVNDDYAEFPDLKLHHIQDFELVKRTLQELNQTMIGHNNDDINEEPIRLRIYSSSVPDLCLVDLPGYIRINNVNQSVELQDKIHSLCRKYLSSSNIILAVSSADSDLANSEALRESRRIDPFGTRTLGVLTKMDLIEVKTAIKLLQNKDYPLDLGYVGIICHDTERPLSTLSNSSQSSLKILENEMAQRKLRFGVHDLCDRLSYVLTKQMMECLSSVREQVQLEMDDTKYQLTAIYDSRYVTAQGYVSDLLDAIKSTTRGLAKIFDRELLRFRINLSLLERIVDGSLQLTSVDPSKTDKSDLQSRNHLVSLLTRHRLGKNMTHIASDIILSHLKTWTSSSELLVNHLQLGNDMLILAQDLLSSLSLDVAEQIEMHVKPLKYEMDYNHNQKEWKLAYDKYRKRLEERIQSLTQQWFQTQKQPLGGNSKNPTLLRKLVTMIVPSKQPISTLAGNDESSNHCNETAAVPEENIEKLHHQLTQLEQRLKYIKTHCKSKDHANQCAEVALTLLADKLGMLITNLIAIELVNEFTYRYPREIDTKFLYTFKKMDFEEIARQNPHVREQLDLQSTLKTLETTYGRITEILRDHHHRS
jgi:GTP-binding protein EngB required for normal cell division